MLARVLLHVVTAASGVDDAVDARSRLRRQGAIFEVMQDAVLFVVENFRDPQLAGRNFDPARIEQLAAAGGIKGGAVEHDRGAVSGDEFGDLGVKFGEKRISVIEALGHRAEVRIFGRRMR